MISIQYLLINIVSILSLASAASNAYFSDVQLMDKYTNTNNCTDVNHWFLIEAELFASKGQKDDIYLTVPTEFGALPSAFDLLHNDKVIGAVTSNSSNILTVSFSDSNAANLTTSFNFLVQLTNSSKSAIEHPQTIEYTFDVSTGSSFNNEINYLAKDVSAFSSNGGIYKENSTAWFTVDIPVSALSNSLFVEAMPEKNGDFTYNTDLTEFEIVIEIDNFNNPIKSIPFTTARDLSDESTIRVLFSTNISGGKYLRMNFYSNKLKSETITNLVTFANTSSRSLSKRHEMFVIPSKLHSRSLANVFVSKDSTEVSGTESDYIPSSYLYSNVSSSVTYNSVEDITSLDYETSSLDLQTSFIEDDASSSSMESFVNTEVASSYSIEQSNAVSEYSSYGVEQSSSPEDEGTLTEEYESSRSSEAATSESSENYETSESDDIIETVSESLSTYESTPSSSEIVVMSSSANETTSSIQTIGIDAELLTLAGSCSMYSSVVTSTVVDSTTFSSVMTTISASTRSSTSSSSSTSSTTPATPSSTIAELSTTSKSSSISSTKTLSSASEYSVALSSASTTSTESILTISLLSSNFDSTSTNAKAAGELTSTIVTTTINGEVTTFTTFLAVSTLSSSDITDNTSSFSVPEIKSTEVAIYSNSTSFAPEIITSSDVEMVATLLTTTIDGVVSSYTTYYAISTLNPSQTENVDANARSQTTSTVTNSSSIYSVSSATSPAVTTSDDIIYSQTVITTTFEGSLTTYTTFYPVSTIYANTSSISTTSRSSTSNDNVSLSVVTQTVDGMKTSYITTCPLSKSTSHTKNIDAEDLSQQTDTVSGYTVITSTISGKVTKFTSWYAVSTISSSGTLVKSKSTSSVIAFTAYSATVITTTIDDTLTTKTTSVPYTTISATDFTTLSQELGYNATLHSTTLKNSNSKTISLAADLKTTTSSTSATSKQSSTLKTTSSSSDFSTLNSIKESSLSVPTSILSLTSSTVYGSNTESLTTTSTVRVTLAPGVDQVSSILGQTSLITSISTGNSTQEIISQYEDSANIIKSNLSSLIVLLIAAFI
ncbi:hypothetical protein TPHA_0P01570 [Tetrapisispora phaffii CBS 4417]|uniref:Uncharacterized protein n=1 Tax=Tetrapisispora phaffii (strain ATCC 24235 / CBS 4417 / NBRC 1672 / NRRL Y-8282 / UCD 70-5) TaxID=1071381 RepID=G8C2D7_TETPH|nr:hypothetical protein TPHA_0P01570 [Tetrapisispora phaffii CBS 4417]CCE66315.1 hypothetical protein TPHA_0P01570 [Tetrapisispora phaffii CBS 4417]